MFNGIDQTLLREKIREAKLGVRAMNLHSPPEGAYWGKFNNRPLDKAGVKGLVSDYHADVKNCTDKTAINMVLRKSWLADQENFETSAEGRRVEQLEEIILTEEGAAVAKNDNLWMMGGNHRHQALLIYVEEKKKILSKKEKELKSMGEASATEDTESERSNLKREIVTESKKLELEHMWAVRLYD